LWQGEVNPKAFPVQKGGGGFTKRQVRENSDKIRYQQEGGKNKDPPSKLLGKDAIIDDKEIKRKTLQDLDTLPEPSKKMKVSQDIDTNGRGQETNIIKSNKLITTSLWGI
jgi:hypothetical protein